MLGFWMCVNISARCLIAGSVVDGIWCLVPQYDMIFGVGVKKKYCRDFCYQQNQYSKANYSGNYERGLSCHFSSGSFMT